jgi:hypothetical protein
MATQLVDSVRDTIMSSNEDTQIASWKTVRDWNAFRKSLVVGDAPQQWEKAFEWCLSLTAPTARP